MAIRVDQTAVEATLDRVAAVSGGVFGVWHDDDDDAAVVTVRIDESVHALRIAEATADGAVGIATEPGQHAVAEERARTRALSFLRGRPPGSVVLDEATRRMFAEDVLVGETRFDGHPAFYVVGRPGAEHVRADVPRPGRLSLETVLSGLGALAGLATFAAVVGGATMWARFDAAGIAPEQGVAALPRPFLVTQGIRSLFYPLLLGGLAAALAYVVSQSHVELGRHALASFVTWVGSKGEIGAVAVAVSLVVAVTVVYWTLRPFELRAQFVIALVTIGLVALVARVLRSTGGALRAVLAFSVVAVWGGVVAYIAEGGRKHARLESASIVRNDGGDPVQGMLIGLTADAVYVARGDSGDRPHCQISVVPRDDVAEIQIGRIPYTSCGDLHATGDERHESGKAPPVTRVVTRTVTKLVPTIVPIAVPAPAPGSTGRPPGPTTTVVETLTATTTVVETVTAASGTVTVPAGAVPLGGPRYSIPVSSVSLPDRLNVARVTIVPSPLTPSMRSANVTVVVQDSRGFAVRDALVYARGLIYRDFEPVRELTTDRAGVVTFTLRVRPNALRPRRPRLVLFVRARKLGEPVTGGVSQRRLVQIPLAVR